MALLIVKNVTIKIKCAANKTKALQKYAESTSSSGGGFLCFSVSRAQSETHDSQATNSYAMGAIWWCA